MATTVALNSVTTTDAVPTTAPHRISSVSGENVATVVFTPATSDASPIRAWRIVFNSNARNGGKLVANRGFVCGLDRCGAPDVMPMAAAQGVQRTQVISYSETGGVGDAGYTVTLFACSDTLGWNS